MTDFLFGSPRLVRTDGFTGTAATTTAAGLDTVLLEVGEVGMARAGEEIHCAATVVLGSLILIANHHANWCAQGNAKFCARLDLNSVFLIPRGSQSTLAGTATGHLRLDVGLGELHARRASIDNAADRAAVRLAIAELC
jgi:hypothetical protein